MESIHSFTKQYYFLSNFYPTQMKYRGYLVASSEHAFQLAKLPDNAQPEEFEKIAFAATPGLSKKAGRNCRLRSNWEEIKEDVMREILKKKFSDKSLQAMLLKTQDAELIEGNYWGDRFWGVGNKTKKGKNRLGKILMELRSQFQENNSFLET